MAFGWDDAIGAGFALGGGILNLFNQGQQQGNQQAMLKQALLNQMMQFDQAQKQYELATASRTDARGNKVKYAPGVGWTTETTPETADAIRGSDAVTRQNLIDYLMRGADERQIALGRRLNEGSAASPLLAQLKFGYGAPSKESVIGANKVAAVTGAGENADNAKHGYSIQALRSGMSTNPTNFSNIDKGATTGIRKALADVDAGAGPLYDAHMSSFTTGKLNPYNTLASRASNVENIPFAPDQQAGNIDASMANAAAVGATKGTASDAIYRGNAPVIGAMAGFKPINYDTAIGGLGQILQSLLRKSGGGKSVNLQEGWDSGTGMTY